MNLLKWGQIGFHGAVLTWFGLLAVFVSTYDMSKVTREEGIAIICTMWALGLLYSFYCGFTIRRNKHGGDL